MNVAENFQDKMLTAGKSSVECPHGFYKQRLTALASNNCATLCNSIKSI